MTHSCNGQGAGPANCGVVAAGPTIAAFTPGVGNSCNPDYSFWEAYTRTQWHPVPQLDIGLQVMYTRHNTAYKARRPWRRTGRGPQS